MSQSRNETTKLTPACLTASRSQVAANAAARKTAQAFRQFTHAKAALDAAVAAEATLAVAAKKDMAAWVRTDFGGDWNAALAVNRSQWTIFKRQERQNAQS